MRQRPLAQTLRRARWLHSPLVRRVGIAGIVTVIWLVPLVSASAWINHHSTAPTPSVGTDTGVSYGTSLWQQDTRTSAAIYPLATQGDSIAIDPSFAGYYSSHNGSAALGNPLTPAYPIAAGLIQFFTTGALLLPKSQQTQVQVQADARAANDELLSNAQTDSATSILRLPLVSALLTAGSEARVGGPDGTLTYVDLRRAAQPNAMAPAPAAVRAAAAPTELATGDMFVPDGKSGNTMVGHLIPQAIYSYISSSNVSPDGWLADFGSPLTAALPLTASRDGAPHHLTVQIFWRGGVIEDSDARDASGAPTMERLDTGAAYLETLGPPQATPAAGTDVWAAGDTVIASAAASTTAQAHVGQNFALALTGASTWLNGSLWYGVTWHNLKQPGSGWVQASDTTFVSPGSAPAWASFDALSPDLAKYLDGLGQSVGAVVYDETRGQYYTYNPNSQYIMASSAKVPIMLTFLTMTEQQGREPNDNEMYLLTTMIENSDNDSAQALFDEIGGAGPMSDFARGVHVSGLNPDPDAWGWSTVSPLTMVRFLTLLHDGKILNAHDRALALNLMENIESDQQNGVGNTAPSGATVAMKDGWVPAPDGLWAMNSSGIVTVGNETYIIAVYSQEDNQLSDGWNITQNVAGTVGKLLTQ